MTVCCQCLNAGSEGHGQYMAERSPSTGSQFSLVTYNGKPFHLSCAIQAIFKASRRGDERGRDDTVKA